jgi:hypothetical protein
MQTGVAQLPWAENPPQIGHLSNFATAAPWAIAYSQWSQRGLRAGVIAIKVAKLRDTPVTNQFERLRIVLIDTAMADVPSSPFDHKHNLGGLVFAFAASKP